MPSVCPTGHRIDDPELRVPVGAKRLRLLPNSPRKRKESGPLRRLLSEWTLSGLRENEACCEESKTESHGLYVI